MLQLQRPLAATLVVFGLLTAPLAASADEPTLADKASARDLFTEGVTLREKGDHVGALAKFKSAYALWPSPNTGLELGREHMAVGELIEARERFLETVRLPAKSTESAAAKAAREESQKLADELGTRIPTLLFKTSGLATGVTPTIEVDGRKLPAEAATVARKINPGKHTVTARATGYNDLKVEVEIVEGAPREVPLGFTAAPSAPSAAGPAGEAPVTRNGNGTLMVVGFGVAAAGVIVGGIAGGLALSKSSSLESACGDGRCPPSAHDDVDAYYRWGTISTISFVVAGVGGAVGVYGLVTRPAAEPTTARIRVTPWIGLGSAGLNGAF